MQGISAVRNEAAFRAALLQDNRPSWADAADAADMRPASIHGAAGSQPTAAADGPPPGFEHVQPEQPADQLARGLAGVQARAGLPLRTGLSRSSRHATAIIWLINRPPVEPHRAHKHVPEFTS